MKTKLSLKSADSLIGRIIGLNAPKGFRSISTKDVFELLGINWLDPADRN